MFERFTAEARRAVTGAQRQARELGAPLIGSEHLLLALADGGDETARILREHGLAAPGLRVRLIDMGRAPLDAEALRSIGIDLDSVREATEASFGAGALDHSPAGAPRGGGHARFGPEAKKALELSLRHAIRLKHRHVAGGHILLGVLHDADFTSVRLATRAGADVEGLRAAVTRVLTAETARP